MSAFDQNKLFNVLTETLAKKLSKRQQVSNVGSLTQDDLLKMCPLSKIENQDVLSGCLAGIVSFCQGKKDLSQCYSYYETTFTYSIYKSLLICAPWKSGTVSDGCKQARNNFSASFVYTSISKTFADFFATVLFSNRDFAPCIPTTTRKCYYPPNCIPTATQKC